MFGKEAFLEYAVDTEALKGGRVDETTGVPLRPDFFEKLPFTILRQADHQQFQGYQGNYNLLRPSVLHGRAFDIRFGGEDYRSPQMIYGDEFGNMFTSLGTKGNDGNNIHAIDCDIEPSGLRIIGLQDGAVVQRVAEISKILRENGVDTEWLIASRKPSELPKRNAELVGLRGLKKVIKNQSNGVYDRLYGKRAPEFRPKNLDTLDDMSFAITFRGLKTPYRLDDIYAISREDQTSVMSGIIKIHNIEEARANRKDPNYSPNILADSVEGYFEYITKVLPVNIGKNLAKMHNLGMFHGFLHAGNISLMGGIYDLDSVSYPGMYKGDERLTEKKALSDINNFTSDEGELEWFHEIWGELFLSDEIDDDGEYVRLVGKKGTDLWKGFLSRFYRSYFSNREFKNKKVAEIMQKFVSIINGDEL